MIDILGNHEIPKYITRNNHRYKFIKKYNTNLYLYEDINYKFKECFIGQDLFIIPSQEKILRKGKCNYKKRFYKKINRSKYEGYFL